MTNIGNNIKKIRTTKGLSQQAFADIFGLSRGNISSYEENRAEPRIEVAVQIAQYFSIPFESFANQMLTVNQILNFKGDKLLQSENTIDTLQLKEVPYINNNIYLQSTNGNNSFLQFKNLPKLVLPSSNISTLLALTFNSNIPHPIDFPKFVEQDILIFEEVTENNFHLSIGTPGLFIMENELIFGNYEKEKKVIKLVLNELKSYTLNFPTNNQFWKLHAFYKLF